MNKWVRFVEENEDRNEQKRTCLSFGQLNEKENAYNKTADNKFLDIEVERWPKDIQSYFTRVLNYLHQLLHELSDQMMNVNVKQL